MPFNFLGSFRPQSLAGNLTQGTQQQQQFDGQGFLGGQRRNALFGLLQGSGSAAVGGGINPQQGDIPPPEFGPHTPIDFLKRFREMNPNPVLLGDLLGLNSAPQTPTPFGGLIAPPQGNFGGFLGNPPNPGQKQVPTSPQTQTPPTNPFGGVRRI